MKNSKKWIAVVIGIIAIGILSYFLIPHVKFWILYGLDYEQKDRFHIISKDQTYYENYKLYRSTIWIKEYEDWLIDRLMLDKIKVEEDRDGFTDGMDRFLRDYNLLYYFNMLQKEGDKTIYEKTEEVLGISK